MRQGDISMNRYTAVGGLLLLALFQTGCCCLTCSQGCGRSYWGAYAEDPPRCEPCDNCGNFTGPCGGSGCNISFPWDRCRANGRGLFATLLGGRGCCGGDSCSSGCAEPACEPTCAPTCEATCAPPCEPACGEPGCGVPNCTSCGHASMMEAAVAPPWRTSTPVSNVSYRRSPAPAAHSAGCNCGKH